MGHAILIIAPEAAGQPVADALRRELDAAVDLAANRRAGLAALRRTEFSLVLLEESLAAAEPSATEVLYLNAGSAPVLEINFAITGATRVVRQVRSTLVRRVHDREQARAQVAATLESELRSTLAGLLLESQLALREALPAQQPKLRHVVELAGELRNRLSA